MIRRLRWKIVAINMAMVTAVLLAVFLVVSLYRHRQIRRLAEEIDEVLHSGRTVLSLIHI